MRTQHTRQRLLATTFITGAAMLAFAAPAFAQDASDELEEVVVTGSRIVRQDYQSTSPVATVGVEQIQARGDVNVEQILNALPQVVPGFSANSNNPANGSATVDLRGLGASRTLVLVNGHRFVPFDSSNAVDLNAIPAALIERVEIVTGGASATYGSDALAGVVNFIFKDDYEGLGFDTQYGISEFGDGEQFNMSATFGSNFAEDRGNITGFVGYYKRDGFLPNEDRPWSLVDANNGSGTGIYGGLNNVAANPYTDTSVCLTAAPCRRSFRTPGVPGRFVGGTVGTPESDRYNFSPVNFLQSPAERYNTAFIANYDVTERLNIYGEFFYSDSRNSNQLAPTPATSIAIPVGNFFVQNSPALLAYVNSRPDPLADLNFDRRMVEVGPRGQTTDSDVYQFNGGARYELGGDWTAEAYYGFGRTETRTSITNDVSRSRVRAALAPGGTADSCSAAALAIFPTCAPLNMFGPGTITPDAVDFISLDFSDLSVFERQNLQLNFTGTAFELPAGPVGVAFGAEYREDSLASQPDDSKVSADIFGFNAAQPVSGRSISKELYFEASVPLISDVPFINSLELEIGGRMSDYDTVGIIYTYKAGGSWAPIEDLRFRGMFQRAARAPNVFELFQGGDQGFPQALDPCTTINPSNSDDLTDDADDRLNAEAGLRAFCTAQLGADPITSGFVQLNIQTETLFYGNPNLSEEESDTVTLGAVWQPSFVPGLNLTLDYYDISVSDYITTQSGGVTNIIEGCFATQDLTSAACNSANGPLIFRDAAGQLKARAPLGNVSELETKGVDFTARYGWAVPWSGGMWGDTLDLALNVTYLDSYVLDGIDYKGSSGAYNISLTAPEWKGNISLGYDFGPVRVNYVGTYIDSMINQGNIPDFQDGGYRDVDSFFYHDVSASFQATDSIEVFAGVRNLAGEEPPVYDFAPDGNTDPNAFDVVGRYFFAGARLRY